MTVRRYWLSSSGETTTHGHVFRISLPNVGVEPDEMHISAYRILESLDTGAKAAE